VIKPAYSVSFLLSINIFVWQNVLYFPNDIRSSYSVQRLLLHIISFDITRKWKSWHKRRPQSSFLWLCRQIQSSEFIKLPVFALSCWKKDKNALESGRRSKNCVGICV